jgi:hypothetical protein
MATTTFSAIRAGYITAIEALTPSKKAERTFKRSKKFSPIEERVADNATSAVFREFEIISPSGGEEAEFMDPSQFEVREQLQLKVAYPNNPGLYGSDGLDDAETLIEADADQIRDTITSASNYVSGQNLCKVLSKQVDRSDENVWLLTLEAEVLYYKSQTL